MRVSRSLPRGVLTGLIVTSVALLAAACGDDDPVDGDGGQAGDPPTVITSESPSGEPDALCAEVITDDVVETLGWSDPGEAVELTGRCEREGGGNAVTVGADPTVRPDDDPAQVQDAYEAACQALSEEDVPEQDPDWLDGESACVLGLQDGATSGFVVFFTVSDSGWLVQGQLAQSSDATTEDLQSAVATLVRNAVAADWG